MNAVEQVFAKSRAALYDDLIEKHIQPLINSLNRHSVEYYLKTGTISGSFKVALHALLKENDEICDIAYSPVWISVEKDGYPDKNMGVLVFIPEEDNLITAGMWDIDENWVLLDEYRKPTVPVTHWMKMPESPKP